MSDRLRKNIGKIIREERERQGMSQRDFAKKAKIDRKYLTDIESGIKNASIDWIEKVAKALDIPLDKLFK